MMPEACSAVMCRGVLPPAETHSIGVGREGSGNWGEESLSGVTVMKYSRLHGMKTSYE